MKNLIDPKQHKSKYCPVLESSQQHRKKLKAKRPHLFSVFRSRLSLSESLPDLVDFRSSFAASGPVYDQGSLGSCTAHAFCAAYRSLEPQKNFLPSRLYLYYKERLEENDVQQDGGADPQSGIDWVQAHGICPESDWAYDPSKVFVAPPAKCDSDAVWHKISGAYDVDSGQRVNLLSNIKTALANQVPVILGIGVYQSFFSTSKNGLVPMPDPQGNYWDESDPRDPYMGGHAVCALGYDETKQVVIFVNSWSSGWGDGGYGYLPYQYLLHPDLGLEFLAFTHVIESSPPPIPVPQPPPPHHTPPPHYQPPQPPPTHHPSPIIHPFPKPKPSPRVIVRPRTRPQQPSRRPRKQIVTRTTTQGKRPARQVIRSRRVSLLKKL